MKNKNLKQEIDQNLYINEVFVRQSASDLAKASLYLLKHYQNDLFIRLSSSVWNEYADLLNLYPKHQVLIWRQYIASQILELLAQSNRKRGTLKKEIMNENLFKIRFLLEKERLTFRLLNKHDEIKRIHFMMEGVKDEALCQAVKPYLSETVSQPVMIYTHGTNYLKEEGKDNTYWQQYDYLVFDEYKEGIPSQYRKLRQSRFH